MGKGSRTRKMHNESVVPKEPESSSSNSKKLLMRIVAILIGVAFLGVFVFAILFSTGTLQRSLTAIEVGDEGISAMDFGIFYSDVRTQFLSQNGTYLEMSGYTIDSTFDSQVSIFDITMTWGQYFNEQAISQVKNMLVLIQEAEANGHTYSETLQTEIDQYMVDYQEAAAEYGVSYEDYISLVYGSNVNSEDVRRVVELRFMSSDYYDAVYDSTEVTADDIEEYYLKNLDSYDVVDVYTSVFPYTTYTYTAPAEGESVAEGQPESEEEAAAMTEESKAEAKAEADAMLEAITDEASFDVVAEEIFNEAQAEVELEEGEEAPEFESAFQTVELATASGATGDWYKDAARQEGDKEVIDQEGSGYYTVAYFVSRYTDPTMTASARHILLELEEYPTDATDEQKEEIDLANDLLEGEAETILEQWKADGATEDGFAKLAEELSADQGSVSNGGLYEDFSEGDMVEEFNDWVFEQDNEHGDTGVVKTDFGYHIMYFVEYGRPAYEISIETTLKDDAYTTYYAEAEAKYPLETIDYAISLS